jgi:hypothetical protein
MGICLQEIYWMMNRSGYLKASHIYDNERTKFIHVREDFASMSGLGPLGGGWFFATGLIQVPFSYSQAIVLWLIGAGGVLLFLLLLFYFRQRLPPRYQMMLEEKTKAGGKNHEQMGA